MIDTEGIEPVYAPNTAMGSGTWSTASFSDASPMVAWVCIGSGSNVDVAAGGVNNPQVFDPVTQTRGQNTMVDWQPTSVGAQLPESPLALALPTTGAVVLFGAGLFARRRSLRSA